MITKYEFFRLVKIFFATAAFGLFSNQSAFAQDVVADTDTKTVEVAEAKSLLEEEQQINQPELGPREEELYSPSQLQALVGPYALYPDDLLAIVLPASTYPLEVVLAARFLEEVAVDASLEPEESWDDSIVALLNYPEIVEMMNDNIQKTWQLGEAVISQQPDVIQAIESFRQLAYDAGNLQSDERQAVEVVQEGEQQKILISQVEEKTIYVPKYVVEEVLVEQHVPVYRYHSIPRPVYYYPYPIGYHFDSGFFWGVTTAFSIGWSDYFLHVYHPTYRYHPYYGHRYYHNDYHYRSPSINIFNNYYVDNSYRNYGNGHSDGSFWRPQPHFGARPFDNRSNNYYATSNYGRRRGIGNDVSNFELNRESSRSRNESYSSSDFDRGVSTDLGRRSRDHRDGGRINGERLSEAANSNSSFLNSSRRQGNVSNAQNPNSLRSGGVQSVPTNTSSRSAVSREIPPQNMQQNTQRRFQPKVQQNGVASFESLRNQPKARAIPRANRPIQIEPGEQSFSLFAPSSRNGTVQPSRTSAREIATPGSTFGSERGRVTTDTRSRQMPTRRQQRHSTEITRPSSGVTFFNDQSTQRRIGAQGVGGAGIPRQPSSRSSSGQDSSSFNFGRRDSSSVQRSQGSRPQISTPQVRTQDAPRSSGSAFSFSNSRAHSMSDRASRTLQRRNR